MTRYYRFDHETGEFANQYLDSEKVYPDTHESLTVVEPPEAQAGNARVFDRETQTWSQVEDHRGQTIYSTISGAGHEVPELGPIPDGFTFEARPSEWHAWQSGAWVEDTAAKDAHEAEEQRREGFRGDDGRRSLLERLQTATPGQIDNWVDSNVTNLASAKVVLAGILKVIALDGRT
jgi:hypothetical protein